MDIESEEEGPALEEQGDLGSIAPVQLSLNALIGGGNSNIMTLTGCYKGMPLLVLIDSGSTHNFLSTNLAKKLNCPLQAVKSVKVTVANGADLHCTAWCPEFTWKMQGRDFCADVYLLPLDNYDLILGTQWLATLGDIMWNFTKLQMSFMLQGQLCQLQGEKEGQLNTMDWEHMAKLLGRTQQLSSMQLLSTAELWSIQGSDSINLDTNVPPQQFQRLQELLTSYADVFSEPVGLPSCTNS